MNYNTIAQTIKTAVAFGLAVITTALLGSIIHTQFVLQALTEIGADINLDQRLQTTWHDIAGFAPSYGFVVGVGFLIAFIVAALIIRKFPALRLFGYGSAGGVALLCAILTLHTVFEIAGFAGARTFAGLFFQTVAGVCGGYLFGLITDKSSGTSAV